HKKSFFDYPNMPLPDTFSNSLSLITDKQSYNINELTNIVKAGVPQLNPKQLTIFNKVIAAVDNRNPT
ncbi:3927_t:CDS:1, partial [Racocetra persica]